MNPYFFIMLKPKLNFQEQIAHIEAKGISFSLISKEEAENFLSEANTYFRIKSYCKNYHKYPDNHPNAGKYINLDFLYLKELSILDFRLRRVLLKMVIDIEHKLKTMLLKTVTLNKEDDGYSIVDDFMKLEQNCSIDIENACKNKSSYTYTLAKKYESDYPIWCFIELLSFGNFIKLYTFYMETFFPKSKNKIETLLWNVRIIRNAVAHNSCLLNNISLITKTQKNYKLSEILSNSNFTKKLYKQNKNKKLLYDIISVFYVYFSITTNEKNKKEMIDELDEKIFKRIDKNKYFVKNKNISDFFELLKIVVLHFDEIVSVSKKKK